MTLRDLQPGDRFYLASQKTKASPDIFQVAGDKCESNRAAGTATRKCIDAVGNLVDKQCRLEIIKVGSVKDGKQEMLF